MKWKREWNDVFKKIATKQVYLFIFSFFTRFMTILSNRLVYIMCDDDYDDHDASTLFFFLFYSQKYKVGLKRPLYMMFTFDLKCYHQKKEIILYKSDQATVWS